MIEQFIYFETWWCRGASHLEHSQNAINDRKRRSVSVLYHGQQDSFFAVFMHNVLLHGRAVTNLPYIAYVDCCTVFVLDWNVVERLDGRQHRVCAHGVLFLTDLCQT